MKCEFCGINPPDSKNDCYLLDDSEKNDKVCCLLSDEYSKFCYKLPFNDSDYTSILIKDSEYKVQCNLNEPKEGALGTKCGVSKEGKQPANASECIKFSIKNHPCCFYQNHSTNKSACFYLGNLKSTSLIDYDTTVNCYSKFIYCNLFFLIAIVIIIFI